ncbi:ArsR/SmtB family transcription factor [Natrarchaeobius chitinivorans]|uniref:ArsR family transcriptional regulator n=1 Tax=Natrarchaeobius chitinivorans TaxID=1679083 RepID=A0A3N6MED5_NATCH|nr:helix-turn-helix domain-containing protein [Natrarchaeobius chitinivorans]RQG92206.1 ArsR family transcriptional regulator [Natrarchaeobius chitinivorans]
MARLFPFRSETTARDGQPRIVDLEGEDADAVFSALSSTTARRIYAQLDEDPGTPSDVADAIDSSIQNVRYHLENLEEAGLIEVIDTWYSSRGNEMSVYATTDGPLIVTSDESTASQLKTAISRLIGGIGALAGGSLLVQYGVSRWAGGQSLLDDSAPSAGESAPSTADEDEASRDEYLYAEDRQEEPADSSGADEPADEEDELGISEADDEADDVDAEDAPEDESADDADAADAEPALEEDEEAPTADADDGEPTVEFDTGPEPAADDGTFVDGGAEATDAVVGTIPPGLLFFLGGLVVLLAVTIYWYWYSSHWKAMRP